MKKENLKGHYERVHPKRPGSMARPQAVVRPTSWVRKHRRRNILVLTIVAITVLGITGGPMQFGTRITAEEQSTGTLF